QTSASSGPYAAPPSGSAVMQPSVNPETTDANGQFAWEVLPGFWEVEASKAGCTTATTPPLLVPPPAVGLVLTLACPNEPAPPPTTTELSSSANPSVSGQSVTFTATVGPTDGGGLVAFYADGSATPVVDCGAQPLILVGSTYEATCTTAGLAVGTHDITATYL